MAFRYSLISDKSEDGDGDSILPPEPTPRMPVAKWKLLAIISIFNIIALIFSILSLTGHLPLFGGSDECHLASEKLWGRPIPWKKTTLNNRQEFIDSDPWDSKFGADGTASTGKGPNPWNSMWFANWVALENDPAAHGYGFGTPLTGPGSEGNDLDPVPWKEGSQAFGIAVMHQLHCVASIKKAIVDYRFTGGRRGSNATKAAGHVDHCIEVLRQATICRGDMALLRPDVRGRSYTGYDGWGNEHMCRDWDAIQQIVKEHGIHYVVGQSSRGWTHYAHSTE
ncbi:hypothetical protein LX32DRAFT_671527 [Colletotrichum zoysiae]|uniref:Oxidase ustYa n=1 Tax=Colletotrichum zoysiae TaxID=1216348 RepID=A0AAD9HNM3_9PEZI|nr:hypothetical protein LX32DRAFT_671527 [Colletotrichum zoysiae]